MIVQCIDQYLPRIYLLLIPQMLYSREQGALQTSASSVGSAALLTVLCKISFIFVGLPFVRVHIFIHDLTQIH